jgi:alkaline phosphatase
MGLGEETFNGYYDNTDIALKVMAVMGVPAKVHYLTKAEQDVRVAVKK